MRSAVAVHPCSSTSTGAPGGPSSSRTNVRPRPGNQTYRPGGSHGRPSVPPPPRSPLMSPLLVPYLRRGHGPVIRGRGRSTDRSGRAVRGRRSRRTAATPASRPARTKCGRSSSELVSSSPAITAPAMSQAGPAPRAANSGAAVNAPIAAAAEPGRLRQALRRGGVSRRAASATAAWVPGRLDRLHHAVGDRHRHHERQRGDVAVATPSAARCAAAESTDTAAARRSRTAGRPAGR